MGSAAAGAITTYHSAAAHARDHAIAAVIRTGATPDAASADTVLAGPTDASVTPAKGATALVGQTGAIAAVRIRTRKSLI